MYYKNHRKKSMYLTPKKVIKMWLQLYPWSYLRTVLSTFLKNSSFLWINVGEKQFLKYWRGSRFYPSAIHIEPDVFLIEIVHISL